MKKSRIMRVPDEFHDEVKRVQKKHGYDSMSELLREDGVRLFRNADLVTGMKKGLKSFFLGEK